MSSIGSDPRLNAAGLDRIGGQSLDDLRRQQGAGQDGIRQDDVAADFQDQPQGASADAGEDVLNAAAWEGVEGERLLAGDLALEGQLGAMELGQAADHAADAVLDAFA